MDLKEAMLKRHTVRKYTKKEISEDLVKKLEQRIDKKNTEFDLGIKLVINDDSVINKFIKLIVAKNVKNYIIMAGKDDKNLQEKIGYVGADLMLYAQTLGLNTWWIGGTFNKNISKNVEGNKVVSVIVIGYGITEGRQHKSKTMEEVSTYEGDIPDWFKEGVKAALLAPTALNKQDFNIEFKDSKVKIECNRSSFSEVNLGIIKYYFELGAGKDNFEWI